MSSYSTKIGLVQESPNYQDSSLLSTIILLLSHLDLHRDSKIETKWCLNILEIMSANILFFTTILLADLGEGNGTFSSVLEVKKNCSN